MDEPLVRALVQLPALAPACASQTSRVPTAAAAPCETKDSDDKAAPARGPGWPPELVSTREWTALESALRGCAAAVDGRQKRLRRTMIRSSLLNTSTWRSRRRPRSTILPRLCNRKGERQRGRPGICVCLREKKAQALTRTQGTRRASKAEANDSAPCSTLLHQHFKVSVVLHGGQTAAGNGSSTVALKGKNSI